VSTTRFRRAGSSVTADRITCSPAVSQSDIPGSSYVSVYIRILSQVIVTWAFFVAKNGRFLQNRSV